MFPLTLEYHINFVYISTKGGQRRFEVQWENSWETEDNLKLLDSNHLVKQFLKGNSEENNNNIVITTNKDDDDNNSTDDDCRTTSASEENDESLMETEEEEEQVTRGSIEDDEEENQLTIDEVRTLYKHTVIFPSGILLIILKNPSFYLQLLDFNESPHRATKIRFS